MTTGQLLFAIAVPSVLLIGTADHLIRQATARRRQRQGAKVIDFTRARAIRERAELPSNVRVLRGRAR